MLGPSAYIDFGVVRVRKLPRCLGYYVNGQCETSPARLEGRNISQQSCKATLRRHARDHIYRETCPDLLPSGPEVFSVTVLILASIPILVVC